MRIKLSREKLEEIKSRVGDKYWLQADEIYIVDGTDWENGR